MPNIRKYNLASLLRPWADWVKGSEFYSNIDLETNLVAPWSLMALFYVKFSASPSEVHTSLLPRDAIVAWKSWRKMFKLSFLLRKHMSIWGHPEYKQGLEGGHFWMFKGKGNLKVDYMIHTQERRYLTFQDSQDKCPLPTTQFLTHWQVLGFLISRFRALDEVKSSNFFNLMIGSPWRNTPYSHSTGDWEKVHIGAIALKGFSRWRENSLMLIHLRKYWKDGVRCTRQLSMKDCVNPTSNWYITQYLSLISPLILIIQIAWRPAQNGTKINKPTP